MEQAIVEWMLGWILRGRECEARPAPDGDGVVLRVTPRGRIAMLGLWVLCAALVALGIFVSGLEGKDAIGPAGLAIYFALFGTLFLLMSLTLADGAHAWARLTERGVATHRPFLRSRFLAWEDLERITWSPTWWTLGLEGLTGSVHLSVLCDGLGTLRARLHELVWVDWSDAAPYLPGDGVAPEAR